MIRKTLSGLLLIFLFLSAKAQLKSPEEFLGYKIGSHYTVHSKIVNYFNHVAANAPAMNANAMANKPANK